MSYLVVSFVIQNLLFFYNYFIMKTFIVFYKFNFIAFCTEKNQIPEAVKDKKYTFLDNFSDFSPLFGCFFNEDNNQNLVIVCNRGIPYAIKQCLKHFRLIKAAGGIVRNPDNKYLLILRNGRWDLPKGKAETGETIATTASREVEEETGVGNLVNDHLICKTYHVYKMFGEWILKQTSWYNMHTSTPSSTPTIPQCEEGIEVAEWVNKDEVTKRLSSSYAMLAYLADVWQHSNKN